MREMAAYKIGFLWFTLLPPPMKVLNNKVKIVILRITQWRARALFCQ
jgi:hypothetical protein